MARLNQKKKKNNLLTGGIRAGKSQNLFLEEKAMVKKVSNQVGANCLCERRELMTSACSQKTGPGF